MQESGASIPDTSSASMQDSQDFVFFLATFFLLGPIGLLLTFALRGQTSASEARPPWEEYRQAVLQAEQPGVAPVSHSLISVRNDQSAPPVTVVTWTKGADAYRNKEKAPDYKDTWVTVAPHLKNFCQEYVKLHGVDRRLVSRRLEQRLGLPPDSNYDTFVELIVDPKNISQFFRPCKDPSPASNSCDPETGRKAAEVQADLMPADPQKKQELNNRYWFFNNYYRSFASKDQYPWTSLGYTLDWARREAGDDFVKFGESEFIVAAGTPIKFVAATDTVTYCTPQ